ncbi:hypothetical protein AGMMS49546_11640 [Spirochaetia bacterium]|nr:hypothetical protein AGMMS49546_11640 [Spirochaetia bacterium]
MASLMKKGWLFAILSALAFTGCPDPNSPTPAELIPETIPIPETTPPAEKSLAKIEIVTPPAKIDYLLGEIPDFNDLAVKNIYTDETESLTSEYDIQYDTFIAGTRTVTIISKEQSELTASFDITVEKTLIDTGLPVIYINTVSGQEITSRENYIKTNIKIVDSANPGNNLENTAYKDEIRGRGNTSWGAPKKPYRIKFDKKTSLFGYEQAKSWVLLANYLDPTLLMNTVAFGVLEVRAIILSMLTIEPACIVSSGASLRTPFSVQNIRRTGIPITVI